MQPIALLRLSDVQSVMFPGHHGAAAVVTAANNDLRLSR